MTYQEFKASRDHFTVDEYANVKTVEELEKIISYTNNMAKNIIEQGVPDFNGFTNKDEALALYGFAYIKEIVEHRISELKGEQE